MPKYINADDIKNDIKTLWNWETVDGIKSSTVLKQVLSDIDNINEAVVRCKDCKYFDVDGVRGRQVDGQEVRMCKKFYNYPFLANEYCSRGKRRESK